MGSDSEEPVPGSCIVVEEEPMEEAGEQEPAPSGLSKNQLKKQRSKERWQGKRLQKRAEEKAKRKCKRQAMKDAGLGDQLKKRCKGKAMADSTCKTRVAVDMSFDELMSEKDCRRTVQQLGWCYAANRRMEQPLQYHVVGFNGQSRQIYDSVEPNKYQDIYTHTEPLETVFSPSEIVYLTADSENVLDSVEDSKVYVIGGLVDHNSQKGLCYELAQKKGYGHARLPIDEFVNLKTRKVLTINHVFEILVRYSECGDWEKAFFAVVPKRKGMEKKDEDGSQEEEEIPEKKAKEEESEGNGL